MKSTLVCIHVMPHEIELFEKFMSYYKRALLYLDKTDNVTIKASLNLNPELVDWDNSELKQDYFVSKFEKLFDGVPNINEIILDNRLMGTTQQKRESTYLDYDQFIFVDADIAFPEQLLKYQLEGSYHLKGMYILIPQIVKWWDSTWDVLVHNDFKDKEYEYCFRHDSNLTYDQNTNNVEIISLPIIKFGCGMHTLYSKKFWDFIQIPESFGGYGPEDTFGMYASDLAIKKGYNIQEFLLKGIYTNENHLERKPSFDGKVKMFDRKQEFRDKAESNFGIELEKFYKKL